MGANKARKRREKREEEGMSSKYLLLDMNDTLLKFPFHTNTNQTLFHALYDTPTN